MAQPPIRRRAPQSNTPARIAAVKQSGKVVVRSQHRPPGQREYNPAEETSQLFEDRIFEPGQEAAHVRAAVGGTYNLGDFESLRLDVSVSLPCLPSEVVAAIDKVQDLVTEKLEEEERNWHVGRK